MSRRVKYNKPLRVLAETHGISISRLEYRLAKRMTLEDALAMGNRSKEITLNDLKLVQKLALTFTSAYKYLGVSARKLQRVCTEYDFYIPRIIELKNNE